MSKGIESRSCQDRRLFLEALEERIAPAGNVVVVVSGGNITVTGDAQDNDIIIDADGLDEGQVRVSSGDDGTTINGGVDPVIFDGVTGNAKISLGAGGDKLVMGSVTFAKNVAIDQGTGDAETAIGKGTLIEGSLSISAKDGEQDLFIDGRIDGRTSVKFGGKSDSTIDLHADFGDNVKIVLGKGSDSISVTSADFDGNLAITGGGGKLSVTVEAESSVDGIVRLQNAKDGAYLGLNTAFVGGGLQMVVGKGGTYMEIENSGVLGPIDVRAGIGGDTFIANGATLGGPIKLQHGQGNSNISIAFSDVGTGFDGAHAHDVFVNSTKGTASFDVQGGEFEARNVTLIYGQGNATVQLIGADIERNFSLKNGQGEVWMGLFDSNVNGKATITTGIENDAIYLDGVNIGGALSINTSKGDDLVAIENQFIPGSTSVFGGKVSISTSDGDDDVRIGQEGLADNSAVFNRPLTIAGAKGEDYIDYLDNGNTFAVEPVVKEFEKIE